MGNIYFRKEAEEWNQAFPIGNGFLGAMVFGNVAKERIQVNEDSVWSGGFSNRVNPDAGRYLEKIRECLFEGNVQEAEKLADGVAEYIENGSLPECTIPVKAASGINHTVPMKVSGKKDVTISMRVGRKFENCTIEVRQGEKVLAKKHLKKALPAEMIQIPVKKEAFEGEQEVEVCIL